MKNILHEVEQEIERRGIQEDDIADIVQSVPALKNRRVVGGYASVIMVDREGHKITKEALVDATKRFMSELYYRPINVFHSDITCGRILPKWTNPKTGETVVTHVDDTGWYIVAEIRDDVEIADKIWEEVEKGNIRSFSIAGSSKDKNEGYKDGKFMTEITQLDIYECTLCTPFESKIITHTGTKCIGNIKVGDEVLTHKERFRKVTKVFVRDIDEEMYKITTSSGKVLKLTSEHPVLTNNGWFKVSELKEGDTVLTYSKYEIKKCEICGVNTVNARYCSKKCMGLGRIKDIELGKWVPNRKGKTIVSGDAGAIAHSLKTKGRAGKYYYHSPESLKEAGEKLSNNEEFKNKRKTIQTELWKNPEYRAKQSKLIHANRRALGTYKRHSENMKELWKDEEYVNKVHKSWRIRPNKAELSFQDLLNKAFPNEWKYVGDGEIWFGKKNPDFININGKKAIIELNGELWHKDDVVGEREAYFKQYGFHTLIVTCKELNHEDKVVAKVAAFMESIC